ncbi:MAG: GNAT family N-acetyltransferase [Anaerolineaceae bacterium]|nr:GNAT family N-acetyltransferase [Anaerolineaceae bacterium]
MRTISIHDKHRIETYLLKEAQLNIYSIGDLDDFFWPYTVWYGLEDQGEILRLALLYCGVGLPVLLCFDDGEDALTRQFARSLFALLPASFYAHFRPGLEDIFKEAYDLEYHGLHHKMALTNPAALHLVDDSAAARLRPEEIDEVRAFYESAYPDNFFDPRMLNTGHYYGIRENGRLLSIAGIHVYSEAYQVAAIGNVTTLPAARGQGLATQACARLSKELLKSVKYLGLNVRADNPAAIHVYQQLGFSILADYGEFTLRLKG